MRRIKACGVLLFRPQPQLEFLLMKHPNRWDLPKGHLESGESELDCALREMHEETGINRDAIAVQPEFRFVTHYTVYERRFQGAPSQKTLVIFLAATKRPVKIAATEHPDSAWVRWAPPHQIQVQTIDPLLAAAEQFFSTPGGSAWAQTNLV